MKKIETREWNDIGELIKDNGDKPYTPLTLQHTAASLTISGFSTGGFMTANLVSMFNQQIDGAAIFAGGGPCASANHFCKRKPSGEFYSTSGLLSMPILVYHGTQDEVVDFVNATVASDWFENEGARVQRVFIDDFIHVMPSNIAPNPIHSPYESCAHRD